MSIVARVAAGRLTAHGLGGRAGTRLAAAFPVEESDDLMLVTDGGQMIRTPVSQVRIVGRSSQGVTIFRTGKDEKVVSVERLPTRAATTTALTKPWRTRAARADRPSRRHDGGHG